MVYNTISCGKDKNMTLYEQLKNGKTKNGKDITACKKIEKFSNVWNYEIVISENGIACHVERTARTTWRKKYNTMVDDF